MMNKRNIKRVLVVSLGFLFLLIGLAGLVLPILQGWLFLLIGLLLLSAYSPSLRAWIERHTVKYPKIHMWVGKADSWIERIIGKP